MYGYTKIYVDTSMYIYIYISIYIYIYIYIYVYIHIYIDGFCGLPGPDGRVEHQTFLFLSNGLFVCLFVLGGK